MTTDLPVGTYVVSQYRGESEFARVAADGRGGPAVALVDIDAIPEGAKVHRCVWKGERLESRGVLKAGPKKERTENVWDTFLPRLDALIADIKAAPPRIPGDDPNRSRGLLFTLGIARSMLVADAETVPKGGND